MGRKET